MTKHRKTLKIKITHGEKSLEYTDDAKITFWSIATNTEFWKNENVDNIEKKFEKHFGDSLKYSILRSVSNELHHFRSSILGIDGRYLFELSREIRIDDEKQLDEFLAHSLEHLLNIPQYKDRVDKYLAASDLNLKATILHYSSLIFELEINDFDSLIKSVNIDDSTLSLLLSPFIQSAFSDIFHNQVGEKLEVEVLSTDETDTATGIKKNRPAPKISQSSQLGINQMNQTRWIWLIANGSLLIPVLLTLYIAYVSISKLTEMRNEERKMFNSMMKHQLELIEEQRKKESQLFEIIVNIDRNRSEKITNK